MLFPQTDRPRVFALPPGADFPQAVARGLGRYLSPLAPEARARVTILANSGRMQRAIRAALAAQGAGLLPKVGLVTDPLTFAGGMDLPPAVPPLRRRLELSQLVDRLLQADRIIAPRSRIFELSDSLARLFAEMQAEGVPMERLARLDVSQHSEHWQRALRFILLAEQVVAADSMDPDGRLRAQVLRLIDLWRDSPPADPILIAGSTGSRGTTALLMRAVATLPQGAVILPGFDFDMPAQVWDLLSDPLSAEDHPQYRFRRLLDALGLGAQDVVPWGGLAASPDPARNRLVSLALRPAPVTDQWVRDGVELGDLVQATARMTLLEAPSPRAEALAIAARLRLAVAKGQRAALVTPDRDLGRMVTAALDRWRIVPDDSAGKPLALSAPGRFLRHVAALMSARPDSLAILSLLKHPLTHGGAGRGAHLLATRDLELHLRDKSVAFPDAAQLRDWADARGIPAWGTWLAGLLQARPDTEARPLSDLVARHIDLAEGFARGVLTEGVAEGAGALWDAAAGREARACMSDLLAEAPAGGQLSPADYAPFVTSVLQARQVRDPVTPDPSVMIWGTLEARVQGADLVILGGLNEGVWPKSPDPDPWLNRRMRADVGLLLPERQVGLSAHDFQQAIGAPEVVLTRATRTSDAPTIPSRWLNRLCNLLNGLPHQQGPQALAAMQGRGAELLRMVQGLEARRDDMPLDQPDLLPAPRPAPVPPVAARPRELSVTRIKTLIRDPYAIYARNVLGLHPLNPLRPRPDVLLRGTVLHEVLEVFAKSPPMADRVAQVLAIGQQVITDRVAWPAARVLFNARLARVARDFVAFDAAQPGRIAVIEGRGRLELRDPFFTLTARADRIDIWPDGQAHVIDYKTGKPPSTPQQKAFDKQLLLQALMVSEGAFEDLPPHPVARVTFLGFAGGLELQPTEMTPDAIDTLRTELSALLRAYLVEGVGFAARRAVHRETDPSDYDHLSRYGEWSMQDNPVTFSVGDHGA